ncbi:MAG: hypothetical protein K1X78_24165 [Verrucomicrobiaceae bacterium]|nr:hypothetical protein [Verrucomicrobiaceae bacterium]
MQTIANTLNDFPDALSPMVVKELRQGLRTRMFVVVMLVMHVLMVIITLMGGGAQNADGVTATMDGIVTLILCFILPMPALQALANEIKKNTLETLVLTELSAGRIVLGKWGSIALQSLVVALSLMPYIVARYVFGGMDMITELVTLGGKWLIGVIVAALMLCFSTLKQNWLRGLISGLFGAFIVLMGIGFLLPRMFGAGGASRTYFLTTSPPFPGSGAILGAIFALLAATWVIFSLLAIAATRIAPAATNLAFLKRSVNLLVFTVTSLVILVSKSPTTGPGGVLGGILMLASIDALTERANEVPSVYAAFYRRGWIGRLASWFLVPGWHSGILFSLALAAAACAIAYGRSGGEAAATVWLGAAGIWMPAALVQIMPSRRASDLLGPWIIYYVLCNIMTSMLAMSMGFAASRSITPGVSCLMPSLVINGAKIAQASDSARFWHFGLTIASAWPLLLLIGSLLAWRRTRYARGEAAIMAATPLRDT